MLNAVTLIVFGAVALGPALHQVDWRVVLYAVLSLTIVRMVPVALALAGFHARRQTVAFVGWFGPRGLASIVFAIIVVEGAQLPHVDLLIRTVVITVGLSVLVHGLSAGPLSDAYARWFAERSEPPPMESQAAHEHRVRALPPKPDHENWTSENVGICDHSGRPDPAQRSALHDRRPRHQGLDAARQRERAWSGTDGCSCRPRRFRLGGGVTAAPPARRHARRSPQPHRTLSRLQAG